MLVQGSHIWHPAAVLSSKGLKEHRQPLTPSCVPAHCSAALAARGDCTTGLLKNKNTVVRAGLTQLLLSSYHSLCPIQPNVTPNSHHHLGAASAASLAQRTTPRTPPQPPLHTAPQLVTTQPPLHPWHAAAMAPSGAAAQQAAPPSTHNNKHQQAHKAKSKAAKPLLDAVPEGHEGNSKFARALGSTDYLTREKGLQALSRWLGSRTAVSPQDMLKIWKGIYYCFWHSDKPPVQVREGPPCSCALHWGRGVPAAAGGRWPPPPPVNPEPSCRVSPCPAACLASHHPPSSCPPTWPGLWCPLAGPRRATDPRP